MQLHTVPARQGLSWVKMGFVWLLRQPWSVLLMMGGYILVIGVLSMLPMIGGLMPLLALQIATVGFMTASRNIEQRQIVWPTVLLAGLRQDKPRVQALLILGGLYAVAVGAVLGIASLVDSGALFRMLMFGTEPAASVVKSGALRGASLLATLSYVPVSMAFWFAPVLVSWHGMGPIQALFTSFVIVLRNLGAFALYVLQWFLLFATLPLLVAALARVINADADTVLMLIFPMALFILLAFIMSFYASARSLLPEIVAAAASPPDVPPGAPD